MAHAGSSAYFVYPRYDWGARPCSVPGQQVGLVVNKRTTIFSGGTNGGGSRASTAIEGWPHAGFCPLGRIAEDGPIPERYFLTESSSSSYPVRTRLKHALRGNSGFSPQPTSGGTALTQKYAIETGKPLTLSPESKALHFLGPVLGPGSPFLPQCCRTSPFGTGKGPDFARRALMQQLNPTDLTFRKA